MKLRNWGAAGIVISIFIFLFFFGVGLVFAMDHVFKSAVSNVRLQLKDGGHAIQISDNGFLHARRAIFLVCFPGRRARVVAKARLADRSFLRTGTKDAGQIHIGAWDRRGRPDVVIKAALTLTSMDWVDTLESEDLPSEAAARLAEDLGKPDADFIAVHALERGVYGNRSGGANQAALTDCLSR